MPDAIREPHWIDLSRARRERPPEPLWTWLADGGSLTQRLIQRCAGSFRVRLLHQGWGRPLPSEARVLRVRGGRAALLREVELLCDETPRVFARTLIPTESLSGAARQLRHLGDKPLGAVLFADPHTRRRRVQIARILPRHPLFAAATRHMAHRPEEVWGRRTLFEFAGKSLLVNEIFLSGCE